MAPVAGSERAPVCPAASAHPGFIPFITWYFSFFGSCCTSARLAVPLVWESCLLEAVLNCDEYAHSNLKYIPKQSEPSANTFHPAVTRPHMRHRNHYFRTKHFWIGILRVSERIYRRDLVAWRLLNTENSYNIFSSICDHCID